MARPVLLVAAVAVAAALVGGCSAEEPSAGDRLDVSEQGYVSGDGSTSIVPRADRVDAPEVAGTTLAGEEFRLSEHRGEVVVLNVWASWCAPCRDEADDLQQAWTELADREVQFVGLNTRDSAEPARAFLDRFDITYPNVVDTDGRLQLLFSDSLPPAAIPSTLVIDASGQVAARAIGAVDRSRLLGLVEPILAEAG